MAEHGHGTKIYASLVTNPASFTNIGGVIDITGPTQTRDSIDVSSMDSAAKFKEHIPAMLDAGEITFDVNYDGSASGVADTLNSLLTNANTAMIYTVGFFDGTASTNVSDVTNHSFFQCKGLMTGLGHAIPFGDKITQPVTIKLTGVRTFTDLAS